MSARGNNNNHVCQHRFDELDAASSRCEICHPVSNRQRRNQRRAAAFSNAITNNNASQNVRRPVPVIPVGNSRPTFRLPGNQVWIRLTASSWAAKTVDTNDVLPLKNIFNGINEIDSETKIFRLLIGFVAMSAGTFGLVDGVTSTSVPDPPIVGRVGFEKNTYRSRDFDLGGKTPLQLDGKAVVWCLEEHRRDEKRVQLADYWVAISRPQPLMPPEDFLVNSQ
ncbi:coat protein [Privet ringspot virus]|uniref:Coat protein n=1 Tax=Privet ringspot virus TaxID=2169960 RepID=A0A0N9H623_9BROM|nr:coat protein [Privet ringspot virus]ALF95061.1 coat protein [Privet ringspot virus]